MYLRVYDCPRCGGQVSLSEQESMLLAAAPDLLAAAKAALDFLGHKMWRETETETFEMLRAAIAKAAPDG